MATVDTPLLETGTKAAPGGPGGADGPGGEATPDGDDFVEAELLVEEISIDGMCGVY